MISEASFYAMLAALDSIVERSYNTASTDEFRTLLAEVDEWAEKTDARYLIDAVRSAVYLNKHAIAEDRSEFALHREFARKVSSSEILMGWTIASIQNDPRHIPDFWLQRARQLCPVEIKLNVFDAASLRQLQRYMSFYKCERGFAVAPKLTCALPDNIHFIALSL